MNATLFAKCSVAIVIVGSQLSCTSPSPDARQHTQAAANGAAGAPGVELSTEADVRAVSQEVLEWISHRGSSRISLLVRLNPPSTTSKEDESAPSSGSYDEETGVLIENGKLATREEAILLAAHRQEIGIRSQQRREEHFAREFEILNKRLKLGLSPDRVRNEAAQGFVLLTLDRDQAKVLVDEPGLTNGVREDLGRESLAQGALEDLGHVPPISDDYQGGDTGIFIAEGNCLDPHGLNVKMAASLAAPQATIVCRGGYVLPNSGDILNATINGNPLRVQNHSHGSYGPNYTAISEAWDNSVYNTGILAVVAAGNSGHTNTYITDTGAAFNAITVGNYDDSANSIYYTSSYKERNTGNAKPELSAPGVDIQLVTLDTGTSFSAPFVSEGVPQKVARPGLDMSGRVDAEAKTTLSDGRERRRMGDYGAADPRAKVVPESSRADPYSARDAECDSVSDAHRSGLAKFAARSAAVVDGLQDLSEVAARRCSGGSA